METCPITLEEIKDYVKLNCGHKFSSSSIKTIVTSECSNVLLGKKFTKGNFNCPMCRKTFLPSFYQNSAVMVIPLPIQYEYFGVEVNIDGSDVSFPSFVFGCFTEAVKVTTMRDGQSTLGMLRSVQHLYQVCSHTFSHVTLQSCSNKAEGVKNMSECVSCQAVVWEAMRLAENSLKQVESVVPDSDADDFHILNSNQYNSGFNQITSTISSFVNTMNRISVSNVSYAEWVAMGRPQQTPEQQPAEPDADSSGPSTPRMAEEEIDDGSDAVFFICSVCNALCDSYTESAPAQSSAETTSTMCFQCWQNMVDDRVGQIEETEFP